LQEAELANALHLKVFRNEWTEAEAELQIEHFHPGSSADFMFFTRSTASS
jgi:hypothetical protein